MTTEQNRARRATERSSWPGRMTTLDDLPEHEVLEEDPARLIAVVTELTLGAWAMRGATIPDYRRADAPGRMIRPGDAE